MPDKRDARAGVADTSGRYPFPRLLTIAVALLGVLLLPGRSPAQDAEALQPGEGVLTRFSGTTVDERGGSPVTVIDVDGAVASVIDLRGPGAPPRGEPWADAPQRGEVTAAEVGQVFGVAMDDGDPPNVYLSATSAFGLHRSAEDDDWMAGMWGADGGPGTVYRLNAENGYVPEIFAEIRLDGRANSGPALGNIAFDPWNRQLFVSDLETGMIHRLALNDGEELGYYDHGIDGRAAFTDAVTGEQATLPLIAFNFETGAQIEDCPAGDFAQHPECWNYADFRRRVWGLAVRRDAAADEVRLYYAVWSSQGFGNPEYDSEDRDETRNSVWSVRIGEEGGFDISNIRREFFLPDFFVEDADIERAGASHPVADIAFPKTIEQSSMLLAERGAGRNLGLGVEAPFAYPHEARVLRYEIDADGVWQPAGRYDVGFFDRAGLTQPYLRANAAGGVAVGPGYDEEGRIDPSLPGEFVWMTGDALCRPEGPCFDPESGERTEGAQVYGLQGLAGGLTDAVTPPEALMPYPEDGVPYPLQAPGSSYLIDANGDMARDDATWIGDIEVYEPYAAEALAEVETPGEMGGFDWGVPDYADEAPWWPEPLPGAGGGAGPAVPVAVFDLAVQKAIPTPCQPGTACDFFIVVTNTGTVAYTDPITIVDELANGWTLAGWGPAGSQWACQQSGTQLSCTHPAPFIPPGEAGALSVALMVPPGQVSGQWQNCAVLDFGPGGDADPSNDQGCAMLQFGPGAAGGGGFAEGPPDQRDLAIEKTADSPECAPSDLCSFTIDIRNAGQTPFDGPFRLVETMPAGWSFGSTSPGWWCLVTAGGGPLASCWRELALDPGQLLNLNVTLTPPPDAQAGPIENCAEIDWSQNEADPNPANDRACATVEVAPAEQVAAPPGQPTGFGMVVGPQGIGYELAIDKGPPHAAPGAAPGAGQFYVCAPLEPCPFTVTVSNIGVDKFDGPFSFTDTPKGSWTFAAVSTGWTCGPGPGDGFTCSGDLSLEPGQSASIALELDPMPGVPLDAVQGENCVEIDWSEGKQDGNSDNDRACMPVVLSVGAPAMPGEVVTPGVPQAVEPDLNIRKEAVSSNCAPGEECWFNIIINGTQDFPFTGAFEVNDIPPEGWTFAGGGNLGLWSCEDFPFTHCKYDVSKYPSLPPEGFTSSDFLATDIRFRVPEDGKEGTYKNCVLVTFPPPPTGEMSKSTKTVCANVQVANAPKLTMTKHFDQTLCMPGGECNFIITVKNEGKGTYNGLFYLIDYEKHLLNQLTIDSVSAVSPLGPGHEWDCKIGLISIPGLSAETTHHFVCNADLISPGETVIVTVKATMRDIPSVSELENCSKLFLNKSDPAKLSETEKSNLVRFALENEGYPMKLGGPLTAAEKAAISDYKKTKTALSSGDTSDEITDELVKEFLPLVEDASGKKESVSCAKVPIGQPGLIIEKKGPSAQELGTGGEDAQTAEAHECRFNHSCTFVITVRGNSDAPYLDPIVIEDTSPNDTWRLETGPDAGTGWTCTGTTRFTCTHPPANLTKNSKPLELIVTLTPTEEYLASNLNQPFAHEWWILNCARIKYQNPAQYGVQPRKEYESCYKLRLGVAKFDFVEYFDASGTGSCTPPGCTFYEFTAGFDVRRERIPPGTGVPSQADYDATGTGNCLPPNCGEPASPAATGIGLGYSGPISMAIKPPPKAEFPNPRITQAPSQCAAANWSCTQSGREFGNAITCQIPSCAMRPGDRVTLRLDGRVAPELTEPPEQEETREVCGELEYQPASRPGSIEQRVGTKTKRACVTTTILAKPKLADLQVSTAPQGQCAAGQTCRMETALGNVGEVSFTEGIGLQGQVSPAVSIDAVAPLAAGWSCRMLGGGRYSCQAMPSDISPGEKARLQFELNIPRSFTPKQITHSVSIVWPPGKGDANAANDLALFTIPVAAIAQPRAYDLAMIKTATGTCKPGQSCRFRLRVPNRGDEAFEGTISIIDSFSRRGVALRGTAGGLSCQASGATLNCVARNQVLQPGGQAVFLVDTVLPRVTRNTSLRNCAEIVTAGGIDVDRPSRDDIRALQAALNGAGYEAGPVDGVIGRRTRSAITAARQAFGLSPGAEIDEALVAALFGDADQRDTDSGNDSDCVTVELQAPPRAEPRPTPVRPAPQPAPTPQPTPVRPAPQPKPAPVVCTGGKVPVGNRCVCPSGTIEVRGRCIKPPTIQVIPPAPKPTPAPPPRCTGGKVRVGSRCVCTSGTTEIRGRCVRLEVIQPTPKRAPAPPPCPDGQIRVRGLCVCPSDRPVWTGSQCIPRLQMIPMQVCPPGQYWNTDAKKCLQRLR